MRIPRPPQSAIESSSEPRLGLPKLAAAPIAPQTAKPAETNCPPTGCIRVHPRHNRLKIDQQPTPQIEHPPHQLQVNPAAAKNAHHSNLKDEQPHRERHRP